MKTSKSGRTRNRSPFFFSSRRRHTRSYGDWSSDVCSSDLATDLGNAELFAELHAHHLRHVKERRQWLAWQDGRWRQDLTGEAERAAKQIARQRLLAAADLTGDRSEERRVGKEGR